MKEEKEEQEHDQKNDLKKILKSEGKKKIKEEVVEKKVKIEEYETENKKEKSISLETIISKIAENYSKEIQEKIRANMPEIVNSTKKLFSESTQNLDDAAELALEDYVARIKADEDREVQREINIREVLRNTEFSFNQYLKNFMSSNPDATIETHKANVKQESKKEDIHPTEESKRNLPLSIESISTPLQNCFDVTLFCLDTLAQSAESPITTPAEKRLPAELLNDIPIFLRKLKERTDEFLDKLNSVIKYTNNLASQNIQGVNNFIVARLIPFKDNLNQMINIIENVESEKNQNPSSFFGSNSVAGEEIEEKKRDSTLSQEYTDKRIEELLKSAWEKANEFLNNFEKMIIEKFIRPDIQPNVNTEHLLQDLSKQLMQRLTRMTIFLNVIEAVRKKHPDPKKVDPKEMLACIRFSALEREYPAENSDPKKRIHLDIADHFKYGEYHFLKSDDNEIKIEITNLNSTWLSELRCDISVHDEKIILKAEDNNIVVFTSNDKSKFNALLGLFNKMLSLDVLLDSPKKNEQEFSLQI